MKDTLAPACETLETTPAHAAKAGVIYYFGPQLLGYVRRVVAGPTSVELHAVDMDTSRAFSVKRPNASALLVFNPLSAPLHLSRGTPK